MRKEALFIHEQLNFLSSTCSVNPFEKQFEKQTDSTIQLTAQWREILLMNKSLKCSLFLDKRYDMTKEELKYSITAKWTTFVILDWCVYSFAKPQSHLLLLHQKGYHHIPHRFSFCVPQFGTGDSQRQGPSTIGNTKLFVCFFPLLLRKQKRLYEWDMTENSLSLLTHPSQKARPLFILDEVLPFDLSSFTPSSFLLPSFYHSFRSCWLQAYVKFIYAGCSHGNKDLHTHLTINYTHWNASALINSWMKENTSSSLHPFIRWLWCDLRAICWNVVLPRLALACVCWCDDNGGFWLVGWMCSRELLVCWV